MGVLLIHDDEDEAVMLDYWTLNAPNIAAKQLLQETMVAVMSDINMEQTCRRDRGFKLTKELLFWSDMDMNLPQQELFHCSFFSFALRCNPVWM